MVTGIYISQDKRHRRKWKVRWCGEYDLSGKRRSYCKSFRRKVEAENYRSELIQKFQKGGRRDKVKPSAIEDFFTEWLAIKQTEVRPATLDLYKTAITRLTRYFGKRAKLTDITPRKAARFIAGQRNISSNGKNLELSEWSKEQLKRMCRTILETAVTWQMIQSNPFKGIKTKRPSPSEWHRITPQEYQKLLTAAPTLRWKAFYTLAYTTGARLHELFNLRWSDVDFEKGILTVSNKKATPELPPFSIKDRENRKIPLPHHTLNLLTQWQSQAPENVPYILLTAERYQRVKAKWQQLQKSGRPWRNGYLVNNVRRDFKNHLRRAGIKANGKLSIHTLRKSCAQNWADYLPMTVVQNLLGHSSINTTQQFYTQVDDHHREKAAKIMEDLLTSDVKETQNQ